MSKPWHALYLGVDIQAADGTEFMGQLIYTAEHGISSIILLGDDELADDCYEDALRG